MAESPAPERRGWKKLIAVATGAVALSLGAGVASAGDGGISAPPPPELRDVQCVERCAGIRTAAKGSTVQLSGKNLSDVDEVTFAPHVKVAPTRASARLVEAKVPRGAETGQLEVSAFGARATSEQELEIVDESRIPEAGDFELVSVEATPRKAYYDAARRPAVAFLFHGGSPVDVRIEVADAETGEIVTSFVESGAEPNARNVAKWNGRTSTGEPAPSGRYKFRVGSLGAGKTSSAKGARFGFYEYRFPVPAPHTYGDGFGAGRGHQGQDVFARCGAKLLAARGGRVQWNKTHSAAGNYLVIDGKGTRTDFMYAHLQGRSPFAQGTRVRTGQVIGRVGESGNASGCHLHFEVWSGPGWYEGGEPLRGVQKLLKRWDAWS